MAETIAAISTAPGEGGIGIVRVSGPASLDIMRRMMTGCPDEIEPRHAYYGKVVADTSDPEAEVLDEAGHVKDGEREHRGALDEGVHQ